MAEGIAVSNEFFGLYGGTFDPVHLGHLSAANEVYEKLGLDYVNMVLSANPPHRKSPVLSAQERFSLLALAVEDYPGLCADRCEMEREGPSYMVDTLSFYRHKKPESSLVLILGMEAFNGLMSWHRWEELISLAHIVVTNRAGFVNKLVPTVERYVTPYLTKDKSQLQQQTHGKIHIQSVLVEDVSSTDIRRRLANKAPVQQLLTAKCWAMMQQRGFYTQ